MAYTNAIFYIDLVSGNDATRTSITTVIASNPSGTITRLTKASHGLVTGAVVTLSAFSTWLNGVWKISVNDANSFDLVGAVWQATADASGTVVPFGGSSWADAWKTITLGATAARIAPGDVVRISKTPDPVSLGNGTWTDNGSVVTLATAQTQTIDNCELAWTANTNVTAQAYSSINKQGSNSARLDVAAAFTTGKIAYKALSAPLNLSAYQKISFWIYNSIAVASASVLKICLCSDTSGNTIVDTFYIPAIPSTVRYLPLSILKSGGGNLGANINSIAIYADVDPGTISIYLDNFIACTSTGLNLQSLISKNGLAQGGTEGYYAIQSIDGVNVTLDGNTNASPVSGIGVYSGASETVTTYFRETAKTALAAAQTTSVNSINNSGTAAANIEFQFGYEVGTTNQNGETYLDGLNGNGLGINFNSKSFIKINMVSLFRYVYNIYLYSCYNCTVDNISNTSNSNTGVYFYTCYNCLVNYVVNSNNVGQACYFYGGSSNNKVVKILNANSNANAVAYFSGCEFNRIIEITNAKNCSSSVISFYSASFRNVVKKVVNATSGNILVIFDQSFANKVCIENGTAVRGVQSNAGINYLNDSVMNVTVEFYATAGIYANYYVYSLNHDGILGNNRIFAYQGEMNWQSATKHLSEPGAWQTAITGSIRTTNLPIQLKIAEIAFAADLAVTVKAWVKKDHSTNVGCRLNAPENPSVGIVDTYATKSDDTDWQQLSISFTPTEAGVTEIWMESWYVAGASNTYIGTIEVTQA